MYSFHHLKPVCFSMSSSNCCFLTCIEISQEAGQVVWYFPLLKNFQQFAVIHTVKGFGVINKADVFMELLLFLWSSFGVVYCIIQNYLADVSNLISGSSAFSKYTLNIWKFRVHVLLKPGLENSEHFFASVWNECNCAAVWAFFVIAFFGIGLPCWLRG